jgi:hypothetical protein
VYFSTIIATKNNFRCPLVLELHHIAEGKEEYAVFLADEKNQEIRVSFIMKKIPQK